MEKRRTIDDIVLMASYVSGKPVSRERVVSCASGYPQHRGTYSHKDAVAIADTAGSNVFEDFLKGKGI